MIQAPASVSADLIRRAARPEEIAPTAKAQVERAGWREDLRLFATTWVAGFIFFLLFLS